MEVGEQVSSEDGRAVVWLVMVEEARPEVGLRASYPMAMSLYTDSHTSNMQVVMRIHVGVYYLYHGIPIPRDQYHLNTHLILNSLALTRLRVTTNSSLYEPPTSPILTSITRSDDTVYGAPWSASATAPYHLTHNVARTIKNPS